MKPSALVLLGCLPLVTFALGCTSRPDASTATSEQLLFMRKVGSARQIFVAAGDGSAPQQVTVGGDHLSATWAAEGAIGFARVEADGHGTAFYSIAPGGGGLTSVLSATQVQESVEDGSGLGGLAWSPDGASIAFHVIDLWVTSVFVMPIGATRTLSKVADWGETPAWSRDAESLVFATVHGLWTSQRDGENARELVASRSAKDPTWSPAGDLVAFVDGSALFTIRPDGSGLKQVASLPGQQSHPSFSADGHRLVFANQHGASSDLIELDLTTGSTTLLVSNAENPAFRTK